MGDATSHLFMLQGAEEKQLADLLIARFGDPTKAGLPAGGIRSGHQAQPGREVPCAFEQTNVDDGRCDQRRDDRANARDRCRAAASSLRRFCRRDWKPVWQA
jgi:hypothetical protein